MDFFTFENIAALLSLTALEIVLGIDNIVFIAVLVEKLPKEQRDKARKIGLTLAMFMRIGLLLAISWIMQLTRPLITIGRDFSGRDIILLLGGLFLLVKATQEIHDKLEGPEDPHRPKKKPQSFRVAIIQILLLDIVFSLDSVITAVGMSDHLGVMITAIVVAVGVMLLFSGKINDFIHKHPTFKMLALTFLLLVGILLVAEGMGKHIDRAYVYFAMAFSFVVELLNMRSRKHPVISDVH
jgi:predicted tellurium resistance membrane protein TerC